MRIKNREIRRRRHRKEQKIKDAQRELKVQFGDKKTALAPATKPKAPAKKTAATKTGEPKKPSTRKKAEPAPTE